MELRERESNDPVLHQLTTHSYPVPVLSPSSFIYIHSVRAKVALLQAPRAEKLSELVARVKNLIVELFTNTRIERIIYGDTCISLRFLHSFASFFGEQNKNSAQFSHNFHTFVQTQHLQAKHFHTTKSRKKAQISRMGSGRQAPSHRVAI